MGTIIMDSTTMEGLEEIVDQNKKYRESLIQSIYHWKIPQGKNGNLYPLIQFSYSVQRVGVGK